MSELSQRDFTDFLLGDNVYELARGIIPEIAERLDVELSNEPNSDDLQQLMKKVGPNKVIRDNAEITAIDRTTMADMLDRAGTQKAVNRSLWTPEIGVNKETTDDILLVTCVANWQDRAAKVAAQQGLGLSAHVLSGVRVMDSGTEKPNKNIQSLHKELSRYPHEAEYAARIVVPQLVDSGYSVSAHSYASTVGDELFHSMFKDNPELTERRIAVVRNANAGFVSAVQMRDVARQFNSDFDADPDNPQALVVTDDFPPARTDEQEADSTHYQKPGTGLRQLVLTALKLHLAGGGE